MSGERLTGCWPGPCKTHVKDEYGCCCFANEPESVSFALSCIPIANFINDMCCGASLAYIFCTYSIGPKSTYNSRSILGCFPPLWLLVGLILFIIDVIIWLIIIAIFGAICIVVAAALIAINFALCCIPLIIAYYYWKDDGVDLKQAAKESSEDSG